MIVTINGVPAEVSHGATVAELMRSRTEARHVAVARNGEVVPRGGWETTRLAAGDEVEVLAAVAGG
ncbi:MAG TPA: sulfur carrier protein ThiS [Actinoplanes sp.]|jgi:sulfur carrier protein|nr:sulfur carrier protein ThiS [Actinoplanes sp.]